MKVAIFSESSADEAAIRVLLDGLLAEKTVAPQMPPIRSRGVDAVRRDVPMVLKHLHYATDAEALVIVQDSDRTPPHVQTHNQPGGSDPKCRLCEMRGIVDQVADQFRKQSISPIKIALGLAVPQIEAWYLIGRDPHVSEASWISGRKHGKLPFPREHLKAKVYGTDRPSLELETRRAREEAERIVLEKRLPELEQFFQGGFGALAADVRDW
ncbi:MAG: hypothetical protein HQ582_34890 [Planctomycetes bacterium]|nr:hypothetical protein [Planctomycetota bacterium]